MSTSKSEERDAPLSAVYPYGLAAQSQYNGDIGPADFRPQWSGGSAGSVADSARAPNSLGVTTQQPQRSQNADPSKSLARRDPNQALIATHDRKFDGSVEPWTGFGTDNTLLPPGEGNSLIERDNIEALEELAQKVKRDAQAKRKQIPPFVQKLSSFLDEPKNEHFIRWSEKGDSFIVLDEDEFAKGLIPELFKHNNYASFVRQLNMYGFHKRVGLSDNSMRAHERKNKSPSEYYNQYFRRGHPNFLWLINKPKGKPKSSGKQKNTDEGDSDEDQLVDEEAGIQHSIGSNIPTGRSLPAPSSDSQPAPKKEMTMIKEELQKVRDQQKRILGAITQLQHNNNDLYNQAIMFQNQHDRHQNSINAILKFLANVFRKTLEDQGNMQSVSDIISSMITNQGQQSSHPHQGNVVDLGDFFQTQMDPNSTPGGAHKRARGLLPPIPNQNGASTSTGSPSTASTPYFPVGNQNPEMGHVTELIDGIDTPPSLRHELENNPHEQMMKIIHNHNATDKSGLDFPEAAKIVANAPDALNHDQRSQLADFMVGQSPPAPTMASPPPTAVSPANIPTTRATTARVSPTPDSIEMPSMSPIMRSPQMVPPSLNQINSNQIDLDVLQQLQSEQAAKIQELSEMLGPLSPSGRIPGLADGSDNYFDPSNVDIDDFLDTNAFLNDTAFGADGTDFDFNIDAVGAGGDSVLGSNGQSNGHANSPAIEETRNDSEGDAPEARSSKRRRKD